MNELELKNYLLGKNLDEKNITSIKAFNLEKNETNEDSDIEEIAINQNNLHKIIKFSFENYFLLKRNSRGAKDVGRGNIKINEYLNSHKNRDENLEEIVQSFANTFRKNSKNILVIVLFEIESKNGLLFLTFKPEEFISIVNDEISTTQSFAEIRKGFIKLQNNDIFLFIDNQNTNDPAEYFIHYLECNPTKTEEDITIENREVIFKILKDNLENEDYFKMRTETARYITNNRNTIFSIENYLQNIYDKYPNIITNQKLENIKESYNNSNSILTKDFLIKVNITKDKITLKISDSLSIRASKDEILAFDISEDGNKVEIKIDDKTRSKIIEYQNLN